MSLLGVYSKNTLAALIRAYKEYEAARLTLRVIARVASSEGNHGVVYPESKTLCAAGVGRFGLSFVTCWSSRDDAVEGE